MGDFSDHLQANHDLGEWESDDAEEDYFGLDDLGDKSDTKDILDDFELDQDVSRELDRLDEEEDDILETGE